MTKEEFKNLQVGTIVCIKKNDEVLRVFEYTAIYLNDKLISKVEHEDCISVLCANQFTSKELFVATHDDIKKMISRETMSFNKKINTLVSYMERSKYGC